MLKKPEHQKIVFNHKEVIVQVGKSFYKLKPFKDTDGFNFDKDLDKLQNKYFIGLLKGTEV